MAEVFKRVKGRKLTKIVAIHEDTQDAVTEHTWRVGKAASAVLGEHRDSGDARIEVMFGDVDGYVVLSDMKSGTPGAMSIEFGRAPHVDENGKLVGGMEGIAPLRRGAGISLRKG